jgi:hypothetical protein
LQNDLLLFRGRREKTLNLQRRQRLRKVLPPKIMLIPTAQLRGTLYRLVDKRFIQRHARAKPNAGHDPSRVGAEL